MTEDSLYDLLQGILTLQAKVFTCVSEDTCHKVSVRIERGWMGEGERERGVGSEREREREGSGDTFD